MGGNVTLGGNLSVAAGPYGRNAEASGAVGQLAAVYSYSKTKGLFAGISIEGSVIVERKETNAAFYGQRYSAREILSGSVPKPAAASVLYRALDRRIAAASTLSRPAGSPTDQTGRSSFSAPPPYSAGSTASGSSYMPPSPPSNTGGSIGNVLNKPAATAVSAGTTSTGLRKPPPPPRPTTTAVALFDFVGEQPTDLSFRAGDIITVTKRTDTAEGWWTGECNGRKGDFPGNYVELRQ
nr:SH3 domain-containing YSC84-like protein 1 [Polyrhizophydium stewartii]